MYTAGRNELQISAHQCESVSSVRYGQPVRVISVEKEDKAMKRVQVCLILLLAFGVWGELARAAAVAAEAGRPETDGVRPDVPWGEPVGGLRCRLELPDAPMLAGEEAHVTFVLQNCSEKTIKLVDAVDAYGEHCFGFVLKDEKGAVWDADLALTQSTCNSPSARPSPGCGIGALRCCQLRFRSCAWRNGNHVMILQAAC